MLRKLGTPRDNYGHKGRMQWGNIGGRRRRLQLKAASKLLRVQKGNASMNYLKEDFHEIKGKPETV